MGEEAQIVLDAVAAEAAGFPWVAALLCYLIVCGIVWSLSKAMMQTAMAKLARKPKKTATESTKIGAIAKEFPWYPLMSWGVHILLGAALGLFAGVMSDLFWWRGALIGALGGATNGLGIDVLKGVLSWVKGKFTKGDE